MRPTQPCNCWNLGRSSSPSETPSLLGTGLVLDRTSDTPPPRHPAGVAGDISRVVMISTTWAALWPRERGRVGGKKSPQVLK